MGPGALMAWVLQQPVTPLDVGGPLKHTEALSEEDLTYTPSLDRTPARSSWLGSLSGGRVGGAIGGALQGATLGGAAPITDPNTPGFLGGQLPGQLVGWGMAQ